MVDAELGVVRILFPLLYGVRGVASYTVSLMVNETVITQDECKLTSTFNVNREEIHTKTTFYPQMCRETLPDDGVPKVSTSECSISYNNIFGEFRQLMLEKASIF